MIVRTNAATQLKTNRMPGTRIDLDRNGILAGTELGHFNIEKLIACFRLKLIKKPSKTTFRGSVDGVCLALALAGFMMTSFFGGSYNRNAPRRSSSSIAHQRLFAPAWQSFMATFQACRSP